MIMFRVRVLLGIYITVLLLCVPMGEDDVASLSSLLACVSPSITSAFPLVDNLYAGTLDSLLWSRQYERGSMIEKNLEKTSNGLIINGITLNVENSDTDEDTIHFIRVDC